MPDMITSHLTAKALTLAFRRSDVAESAAALAATAGRNRVGLERALARLRRGLAERASPVVERAAASLSEALALLDTADGDQAAVGA